uniref:Uncharacterized protein n=1 Tax=Arundo donax TaxID=35708 RepID=A0A0A8Y6W0_ARUDO
MKPTFSSCSSNKDNCSLEAKMAAWEVEWKAERAASAAKWHAANSAFKAESEAWIVETAADNAAFSRYLSIIMVFWGFSGICWIRKLYSGSSRSGTSSSKGKRESCGVAGVVDADVH